MDLKLRHAISALPCGCETWLGRIEWLIISRKNLLKNLIPRSITHSHANENIICLYRRHKKTERHGLGFCYFDEVEVN